MEAEALEEALEALLEALLELEVVTVPPQEANKLVAASKINDFFMMVMGPFWLPSLIIGVFLPNVKRCDGPIYSKSSSIGSPSIDGPFFKPKFLSMVSPMSAKVARSSR